MKECNYDETIPDFFKYCHYHNDTYEYFDCLDYMECEECPYYYDDED